MLHAAKWGDLVIGVDMHMVMVPAPPSPIPVPTPMPHVFLGIVFDPLGAAIGAALGGGFVCIQGMPVANAGTDVRGNGHTPTPPGTAFAPNDIPENKGTIVTGSKTVTMAGTSAARMASMVTSCNFPVNLPTSVCMALPSGAPVLVGGPDSFDVMAAVTSGIRTKWFSEKVHKILKAKPGSRLSKTICFLTGHPVDVMTGEVLADGVDFELPGPIPLTFERNYYSRDAADTPLGPGWHHPLNASVHEKDDMLLVRLPDGRQRQHDRLVPGQPLWDDMDRYTLERTARGYRLTFWDGRSLCFEPIPGAPVSHPLVRITDRCDNRIVLRYEQGQLYEVVDSAGRVLRFLFAEGRLRAIRLKRDCAEYAWHELVRYQYDQGRLVAVLDAKKHASRYAYRGGVLVKETNRNGFSFHFEYDWYHPDGWCIRTWGDGGIYDRKIIYDKHRHVTIVDDSRGGRTHYFGNEAGLVEHEIDPTGCEKRYEWSESFQKTAEGDGLGNRTEWAHDERGNTVLERDALGQETRWKHNELNLPVEMIDPAGGVWKRGYDERGKLRWAEDPLGNVVRFQHDRHGNLVAVTNPSGQRASLHYTETGELVAVTDWEGNTTQLQVDAMGRPTRVIDALGGKTVFSWDACNNLESITRPDGLIEKRVHDAENNPIQLTDGLGNTTRYRFGGFNKLVEQIDPAGGTVRYTWDTEENLVGVTNEHGELYTIDVDLAGRVVKETGFDGRVLEYSHDRAGRCIETVNGQKKRTKIDRDALGRIVRMLVPGAVPPGKVLPGVEEVVYEHGPLGLMRARNSACEVIFERDALGRVVKEQAGEHVIESRYDANGHRIARKTSLGHETSYDIDGNGSLRGVTFGLDPRFNDFSPESLRMGGPPVRAPWKASFERNALGTETERRMPGGVVSRWDRDPSGRPRVHRVLRNGEQISATGYQWHSDEQLAALIDTQMGPTRFAHDERSYLVAATRPDGSVQLRAPDAAGNIYKTWKRDDRVYGAGGVLKEADGIRFLHDADGQLIEKVLPDGTTWRYRWDGLGQLTEVTRPDGQKVTFAYDPLGRRRRKTLGDRTTVYVWDGNDVVHEATVDEPLVTWEFDPGMFAPIAKVEGEKRYSVVTDHLGTPKALLDEAGELAWKAQLGVFGVARTDVMRTACPWRWPGQYEDEETGLYYNCFRYYDPSAGRYISQDPVGLDGGVKLYGYPLDPLTWIDPLGLSACTRKPWIKRELYRQLPTLVGAADTKKFIAALRKGIVGPVGESGVKILTPAWGKYTHELKIGASAQRLLGCISESGQIIFDKFLRGGLH
jgi:RHS repeat-associated protein